MRDRMHIQEVQDHHRTTMTIGHRIEIEGILVLFIKTEVARCLLQVCYKKTFKIDNYIVYVHIICS